MSICPSKTAQDKSLVTLWVRRREIRGLPSSGKQSEFQAETQIVVAVVRAVVVAIRSPTVTSIVVPTAPAEHTIGAYLRPLP